MEAINVGGNFRKAAKLPVKLIIGAIVLVIFAILFFNSFYTVTDQEQAVVLTFGKVTSIESAGIHFKLPYPIQSVIKVPVQMTQKLELGYRDQGDGRYVTVDEESKMITGDFNIVKIDFFIEWKVSDPKKYLFNSEDPKNILRDSSLSAARSVVGSSTIDDVLTSGKIAIENEIKEKLIASLDAYDIGIQVLDVKIQDSEPPTEEVKQAFKNVENAKQSKETAMNEANKYRNTEIPKAQAEADRILRNAESQKQTKINEARGEVAKFLKMYEEYKNYKDVTKTRLYLEAMEEILPGITVYIEDNSSGVQKLVPLKPFDSEGGE
ncbi:MAG TPA: FtsH protease activity modulator HflK [Hungateiclostridium thermocellum]|jgi:membrane protease subunit HflK|uniref:Protein HflK n=2 Tax=Acetivibrio thermocellus TaxID=1515 RepID=A3DD71_ACET2|nr:FtsH protease activity modulator HflK [Acetivibrio thermocellus]CDG35359.1 HflK protein [Acetivibrio thermocellus BC1]ABN51900.1 HflK protein [Acetivibrio thermocellus ATCC 27405]ADU74621.1 HflK protein [Acetivibrio thermocellus DSM 1313]ALX08564.1 HflK protein [Acetivibrio thermocellus AD2]ANV76313.1 HflK protein [Acetivibrio thermocellus DSM 2360]